MTNENAILTAKTVPDFFNAINQEYGLALPTDFSDDSPVSKLLNRSITFDPPEKGILYKARGDPLDYPPFNFGENYKLTAIVIITVENSSITQTSI